MRLRAVVAASAVASAALIVLAGPASAHVTVNSPDATQGGFAVLTFRVPTESATVSTTALRVQLPTATPFASVSVQPHPGWTFSVKRAKLAAPIKTDDGDEISQAVSEIDWKATSAASAIKPGEFDQFLVSAGPLPKVSSLTFKAIQIYSDGSQVDWTEVPAPGSTAEPEHPAPTLDLGAATPPPARSGHDSSDTVPVVLSSIALAVAVAALATTVWRRRGAR